MRKFALILTFAILAGSAVASPLVRRTRLDAQAEPAASAPKTQTEDPDWQEIVDKNPEFFEAAFFWLLAAAVFFILGVVLFLFSEINSVIVCRESDFRAKLSDAEKTDKLQSPEYQRMLEREKLVTAPRPYLTTLGVAFLAISSSFFLYPICDLIQILGLPSAPCILVVTFGAFFAAMCIASFLMFLVWSCTRVWASLVFLFISLSGAVLLPVGNPILLLIFVTVTFGAFYVYFVYLPGNYNPETRPEWLQDVGDFNVEPSADKFTEALSQGRAILTLEAKEIAVVVQKQGEDVVDKSKKLVDQTVKGVTDAAPAPMGHPAEEKKPSSGMV